MKFHKISWIRLSGAMLSSLAAMLFAQALHAQTIAARKTQNVIVVMMDGMRWQEVFRGADSKLIETWGPKWLGNPKAMAEAAERDYGQGSPAERRKALMPFLWGTMATQGQVFGNRDLGSDSHVVNGLNFSYPGYSETLTGIADPRVNSNNNVPNPNPTVFAWLNAKPDFAGQVAAFGAWGTFTGIFDSAHCGFPVNAGYDPLTAIPATPELALLNKLKAETPRVWDDEPFDPVPFHAAVEYIKAKKPRLLFLGLGETDEWAHSNAYAEYLISAHLNDDFIRQLWDLVQSMPEYRGKTTLIVLPDHGRGEGPEWQTHGQQVPVSMQTWMAFMGPDTAALGERKQGTVVTESQIAATVAALLGKDYRAAVPKSGAPIGDVLAK
jgi:hypothetical protein